MMTFEAATVSDLVASIKNFLEDEFQEVVVEGEISNLSRSATGHVYFTLSDAQASISCALFKGDALRNPLLKNLKDGEKVLVLGPVSVYQKRGTFQLIVKRLLPSGSGQQKIQFERLKAKLAEEGLFDLENKKNIPKFPKKIALITSEHGAALQDFLNVIQRRSLWYNITIIPALVQGEGAPKAIINALEKASALKDVDLIVITRGGGSMEDLWCFNDESLVRFIANVPIPVISAIGHEVDYTLTDYVADLRSETPTAAAEVISQAQTELSGRMQFCHSHLRTGLLKLSQEIELIIEKFHPEEMLGFLWRKIQSAEKKMSLMRLTGRAPELLRLFEFSQRLDESQMRILNNSKFTLTRYMDRLTRMEHLLKALNPYNVLKRGYSVLSFGDKQIINSLEYFNELPKHSDLNIRFYDGTGKVNKVE